MVCPAFNTVRRKIVNKKMIQELIYKGDQVIGVRTSKGQEFYGNIVLITAGANSKLIRQLGDQLEYPPDTYLLGIKEEIALPAEVIESRFMLKGREGKAINYYGYAVEGNVGSGFLYTNKESLSLGAVINARSLKGQVRNAPLRYLMQMRNHPHISKYLKDGRTVAMSTHIVPEIGCDYMRTLFGKGVMAAGDSAGFINANVLHRLSYLHSNGFLCGRNRR